MVQERRWIPPVSRRRWPALLAVCALAAVVHLLALSGLQWVWPPPQAAPLAAQLVVVRALPADRAVVVASIAPLPQPAPLLAPAPAPAAQTRSGLRTPVKPPVPPVRTVAAVTAVEPTRMADASASSTPPAAETTEPVDEAIPHYRTLIPPAVALSYRVQHGPADGSGELRWRPDAGGYELTLDLRIGGSAMLTQFSQGGFDDDGLAPLRFTDKRARRPASAANFQRDHGTISFSGPQARYPLRPGTQDRLSWMLQLPAIVAAEPLLRHAGSKVVMNVATASGDLSLWAFRCLGVETIDAGGEVLVYLREPRGPYDTSVRAYLDPRRGYLPQRVSWKSGENDAGLELRLQEMTPHP